MRRHKTSGAVLRLPCSLAVETRHVGLGIFFGTATLAQIAFTKLEGSGYLTRAR